MRREGKLRQLLGDHFSREELRSLCFDLGIDYEDYPESKDGLARELILHLEREGRLADLLGTCQTLRPYVPWPGVHACPDSRLPCEPETVSVPAGPFLMGSPPGLAVSIAELSQHEVDLPAYYIGRYPVTNEQYAEFIKQNPQLDEPKNVGWSARRPPSGKERHPVVKVSWYDALAYCRWLGRVTGCPYRLATEAEWEKAARGQEGYIYPWGQAWIDGLCNAGGADISPVDGFPDGGSPYGCLDMVGNAQEWTGTLWGKDAQQSDFPGPYDALDGREAIEADPSWTRVYRIHRGGHFKNDPADLRATIQGRAEASSRFSRRGFRVARDM